MKKEHETPEEMIKEIKILRGVLKDILGEAQNDDCCCNVDEADYLNYEEHDSYCPKRWHYLAEKNLGKEVYGRMMADDDLPRRKLL